LRSAPGCVLVAPAGRIHPGRGIVDVDSRGAATLCPGLCACCPVGAHLSKARSSYIRTIM
ncbi:hypothetical protein, partial [Xylanibacter rodentium]